MTDRTRQTVPVTVANTGNTDYLYTGNESQNALFGINWYDSGARFQTTDGIFTGIDPLAEKYYHLSPYAYCAGNPVNYVDPTGEDNTKLSSILFWHIKPSINEDRSTFYIGHFVGLAPFV